MATKLPTLEISAPRKSLPTCSPNLMPFHIAYTGPAPVSTFFRVKQAPSPTPFVESSKNTSQNSTRPASPTPDAPSVSESQQTLVASSSTSRTDVSTATLADEMDVDVDLLGERERSKQAQLISAFRGRTVRGLTVALPEGYTGLVLDAPEDAKGETTASSTSAEKDKGKGKARKAPASRRGTRRSARAAEEAEASEAEPGAEELACMIEESGPVRSLKPTATFSSFVLWNADIPVDEGRDEYLRTLTEWTKLAAAINHYED